MTFRNYTPSVGSGLVPQEDNQSLGHAGIEAFKEAAILEQSYEKKARAQIKKYLKNEDDPLVNLLPKKANFDLKRGLNLKLDKLNAKTERAIFEIMSKQFSSYLVQRNKYLRLKMEAANDMLQY